MTPETASVPHALLHNLKHNRILHERVIFLTFMAADAPHVAPENAGEVRSNSAEAAPTSRCTSVSRRRSTSMQGLQLLGRHNDFELDPQTTSFFLSRQTVLRAPRRHGELAREPVHLA